MMNNSADQYEYEANLAVPVSTSTMSDFDASSKDAATATAGDQKYHSSLYFSQEASSIFDKALEMHAAADDPPMWGDDLEDLKEVADMLEDMDDLSMSMGNDPFSDVADDSKGKGEASKSDAGSEKNGSSGADLKVRADEDMPVIMMNMDERIFEDSMFPDDFGPEEGDETMAFEKMGLLDKSCPGVGTNPHESPSVNTTSPDTTEASPLQNVLDVARSNRAHPLPTPGFPGANAPVVTPSRQNGAPRVQMLPGTSKPFFTPLSEAQLPVRDPKDSTPSHFPPSHGNFRDNRYAETSVTKSRALKHRQVRCCNGRRKSDAAWQRRYLELQEFKGVHGHCNVHQKYDRNPSLGAWVARQRLIMRQWEDQLEDESLDRDSVRKIWMAKRIECLKNLGLESSIGKGAFGKQCARNTFEWEKQFSDLVKYRQAHGTCDVPTKCTTLGRWVSSQRKKYRQFCSAGVKSRDKALGWTEELQGRFDRLRDIGFNFHVGKGNAQANKKSN